ncbi:MAG: dolichyl-phosphate beta-glucosyltransferase [Myxococcota bacterium]
MISLVFPAYNEQDRISDSMVHTREYCDAHFTKYQVIVVDDGSLDGTTAMLEKMAAVWPNLKVIHSLVNRGKGAATRDGVLAADGEWILCSDVDLSTPIEESANMLAAGRNAPVVIGSRAIKGAHIAKRQPWYRVVMGRVFNWVVRMVDVPGYLDTQCGFKLYRHDAGRAIFEKVTIKGFAFDVEVLFLAKKLGYPVVEVPVRWLNDERSKVHVFLDPLRMFLDVALVRWRQRGLPSGSNR